MVAAERETREGGRERGTGCVVFMMRFDPGQPRVFYSFASIAHFVLLTDCEEQL